MDANADQSSRALNPCRGKPAAAGWELWRDQARSPAMNMAVDDALLETAGEREGRPLVRFYRWGGACFSIGCCQTCDAVPPRMAFVRRPTGGGVVDHRADVTYTVVLPKGHPVCSLPREASYAAINQVVIEALASLDITARLTDMDIPDHVDRRRMVCFTNPTRYDVVFAGRKVAGAAQRRRREGILHQGSVALTALPGIPRESVAAAMQAAFADLFAGRPASHQPDENVLRRARELAAALYQNDAWNRKR